MSRRPRQLD